MTTREQFKRKVIEAIHALPYEKAVRLDYFGCTTEKHQKLKENETCSICNFWGNEKGEVINAIGEKQEPFTKNITIGRVMQALGDELTPCMVCAGGEFLTKANGEFTSWRTTKENGIECTDDDQTEETIAALLNLF